MVLSAREVAKFGLLVGLCAIFIDASVAHGLFWENDPYWTYWITKSFLITTVFIIGTAFFGTGIKQGLLITVAHTLILEIYYQWLAPVGLPQEPEWLDFNHLWTTGVPVHYLAIFTGYLMALWIWRRAQRVVAARADEAAESAPASPGTLAVAALVVTILILVLSGLITHGLLLREFPGFTYFIQHLLTGFVFLYVWSAYVGAGRGGWLVGALMLSLTWTTYSMYLGPVGLPHDPPHYLGYQQLWLRAFPGDFIAAAIGLWAATALLPRLGRRWAPATLTVFALVLLLPEPAEAKPEGLHASASASGPAMRVTGPNPVAMGNTVPAEGGISVRVVEGGNRWSHIQNTDSVDVKAEFTGPDGAYRVEVDRAMPRHPLGKYTTWNGVAFDHEMHGETGIGTAALPRMRPNISIYGWGRVWRDGRLLASMVPTHVMVSTEGPVQGVMLEVDTEEKTLRDVPDGYITVMWPSVDSLEMPKEGKRLRMILGWIGLIGLAALFWWLARRAGRRD